MSALRILLAIVIAAAGCTTSTYAPICRGTGWSIPPESLHRRVDDVARERKAFVQSLELGSLPVEAREAVEGEFHVQFDRLEAAMAAGAQVWAFRYDKCPDCGWYREGYVAVRECQIVYEMETLDTM